MKYEIVNEHVIIYYESAKPAQDSVKMVNIKGTVRDEGGLLLPGVSVMIKGTLVGVATGNDGKFTLNVPVRDTVILVFSFVGMKTLEVESDPDKTEYNVVMKDEQVALDDVVITGFRQTTRQKKRAGLRGCPERKRILPIKLNRQWIICFRGRLRA